MDKFLALLTDLSFRRSATPHLVKFLYVFSLILCAIWTVLAIVGAFSRGVGSGVLALIVAPIVGLFLVCVIRVSLEALISLYRTANYTAELARAQRNLGGGDDGDDGGPLDPEPRQAPVSRASVIAKSGF